MRRIEVVPYRPEWVSMFSEESARIRQALGENYLVVHHIGSTAIPGMYAKPIIDFMVEVQDITAIDGQAGEMVKLGYAPRGEFGLPGRRYFPKIDPHTGQHIFHVHIYQRGHADIERHLAFRDYMIAHPDDARAYGALKLKLSQQFPNDPEGYMDGKDAFVKEMERRALAWRQSGR